MIELSVIRDFVAIFGVIAGFSYYVLTVRVNQKNQEISLRNQELTLQSQKQTLETRQAQLFMSVYQNHVSKENISDWIELINNWEWIDYDDFRKKYSGLSNLENRSKYGSYMNRLEGLGVMCRRGLIDVDFVYDLMYGSIIIIWEKYLPIVTIDRQLVPHLYKDIEYLYDEMIRIRDERADKKIIPSYTEKA